MKKRIATILIEFYLTLKNIGLKGIWMFVKLTFNQVDKIIVPGIKQPIHLRKNTSDVDVFRDIFLHREYNVKLDFEPKTIIDAGANIGLAAVFFNKEHPNATIVSIEPEQSNFKLLSENTKSYTNVFPIQRALSSKKESLNVVDRGYGEWGFMTSQVDNDENSESNIIDSITIPEIMKKHGFKTIDIVKIDIEGYEKELFESNYAEWLPNTKCLIIELHDRMKKGSSKSVFKAISEYNFSLTLKGENLFFINEDL